MFNLSVAPHASFGSVLAHSLHQVSAWLVADECWSSVSKAAIAAKVKASAGGKAIYQEIFKGSATSECYSAYSESYLAQANDISDLETRMANIERAN
jgi:hypothetical protein